MQFSDPDLEIAYLKAKVETLESLLAERSKQLRQLQSQLEPNDLLRLSRLVHGLPLLPRHAYDLTIWAETTALTASDVESTLRDLWSSLVLLDPRKELA